MYNSPPFFAPETYEEIRKSAKYKLRERICSNKMEGLEEKKRGDQQINKESLVSWYVNIQSS